MRVYRKNLPERIDVFEELYITCCNLKLPQFPHASLECLRCLIARFGLCRDK